MILCPWKDIKKYASLLPGIEEAFDAVNALTEYEDNLEQVIVCDQHQRALGHHGQTVHRFFQRVGRHILPFDLMEVEVPHATAEDLLPQAAQIIEHKGLCLLLLRFLHLLCMMCQYHPPWYSNHQSSNLLVRK